MKKLFFVLALVAVYGVSMAMTTSIVNTVDISKSSIVAVDDKTPAAEKEKAKETKAASTDGKAKSEGCGTAKSAGCGEKAKAECGEKKEGTK